MCRGAGNRTQSAQFETAHPIADFAMRKINIAVTEVTPTATSSPGVPPWRDRAYQWTNTYLRSRGAGNRTQSAQFRTAHPTSGPRPELSEIIR